jgi:hypothetical protein
MLSKTKENFLLAVAVTGIVGYTALFFIWGMRIGVNDSRLFQKDDANQVQMMARSCGRHGTLYQRIDNKRFACVYSHGAENGEAMLQPVPVKTLVAGWE